jgi:hypothetical protein
MSYVKVTTGANEVPLDDLGIIIPLSTSLILTNQFSIEDLLVSADLESNVNASLLAMEIDYGSGFTAIAAGEYSNRDVLGAYLNIYELTNSNLNESLVGGSESTLHLHDTRYYTETELHGAGGADLVGVNSTGWNVVTGSTVQQALTSIDTLIDTINLDDVYTNDSNGILSVNGASKNLDFKSDNVNDIIISRTNGSVNQNFLLADVSASQLVLGSLPVGALPTVDIKVLSNLIVEGDITFTGKITDTTVSELNVTNNSILLREGAITDANANLLVNRPVAGADAALTWNELTDRWKAGVLGVEETIALLEHDETVTGVYDFQGGGATEPSLFLTTKTVAPTVNLGTAAQIPMSVGPDGILYVYDKSNSRNKWLSVQRNFLLFTGRNTTTNTNEYAQIGMFPSNQAGVRLSRAATLIGISVQTKTAETWTAQVRKNGSATVLASLVNTAVSGNHANNYNVDFDAGDNVQVYISGSSIGYPTINLEFAYKL